MDLFIGYLRGKESDIIELNRFISETLDGRYKCKRCDKAIYKHKRSLYRHLRRECGVFPSYHCPVCQYQTTRKGSLKTHLIIIHKIVQ